MNCNTTHYRANSSSVPGDPTPDHRLRDVAKAKLAAKHPNVSAGFLADPRTYADLVSNSHLDLTSGVLAIPHQGARRDDSARLFALLQAIYDGNKKLIDEANELNRTVASLTREKAEEEKAIADMAARIQELNTAAEVPTVEERTKLEGEAAKLESAWNGAVANVARISSELKQLRENPNAAAPAPAAPTPPSNDAVLQQLQGEMQQLNQKVSAVQEGRGETAAEARKTLDEAVESFNEQLKEAQVAVKSNPELLAYLTQTQQTLTRTREMTDQLIGRQQEQYGQLSEVKAKLNEKMLARRSELWKKDPELVKLMDQKEYKTRQHNAALGQGMAKEAADIKTELNFLETEISARQTLVADDSFYADAIDQLQKLADSTQKNLELDRAQVLQQLDQMQNEIAQRQPPLEKLTPEQKQMAADMEKRLADVSEARKQYAAAADAANKAADEEIRSLQVSASDLASKVQARKQELAAAGADHIVPAPLNPAPPPADPQVALTQKETELAAAEKSRAETEAAYFAANKKLLAVKQRIDDARAAGLERDKLVAARDHRQTALDRTNTQLEFKSKLAKQKASPAVPLESDVKFDDGGKDRRPVYALASAGAVVALFSCLMLLGNSGNRGAAAAIASEYAGDPYDTEGANDHLDFEIEPEEHDQARPVQV